MASDKEFVAYVCEQLREAGEISSRRMFGEAAVYLGDKVVGLVCDNQLFVKPTEGGGRRSVRRWKRRLMRRHTSLIVTPGWSASFKISSF